MWDEKTVSTLEDLREDVIHLFPDAVRGSVAKAHWDGRRKVLHLSYWIGSDTVGGTKVLAKGPMLYLIEWDTNHGDEMQFAERDYDTFLSRVLALKGAPIMKTVCCK